ncbi:MAG: hypothetical protein F6J90_24070 [Moorea sp. SIOASIH]|uniref:SpvB/TcaC N-terminal domain-containing protein n=1 Tax=Moorena sp. SIOASIH TaxID=2607817 RepID=UPI0013BA621E|nr:SpvB/TcaC N-terminal domain-containing protein [Moorena sp. SIOASIH]NEO39244.1 hypothetical protein [Moorena sp. SIOASIH]
MENQITATQLSLPKGGGAIQGIGETFQASEFTGTASLSIPIGTSSCRGFEPKISVDYSSGSGNGSFGLGFNLSIPNISCKTSKGLPQYDGSDTFLVFNGDDLVPIVGGKREAIANNIKYTVISYRPRTEGLFAQIEQWISPQGDYFWRVVSSDNVTSIFGKTENSRIFDPENPSHIFEWLLSETFNPSGDRVVYEYKSENIDNVPNDLCEVNRSQTANKYIERIKYGNVTPFQEGQNQAEQWLFEVVFDYGEYNLDSDTPYSPVQSWTNRQDSFSTYHAGFEIRTHRLCRSILMFHRFEAEFGSEPILVKATRFSYDETPIVSLMTGVESVGYSYDNGKYQRKSLPPLEFNYTEFKPTNHAFEPLLSEKGEFLPGLDLPPNYSLIDLYGEGIPGILYSDGKTTLYWEPEAKENGKDGAAVSYSPPQTPQAFPIERNVQGATQRLMDLTGNGQMNLVVSRGTTTGYYEANSDRTWQSFQTFPSFPTDFSHPENQLLDMTGDGLTDILRMDSDRIWIYPGKGKEGFGSPFSRNKKNDIPLVRKGSESEIWQFTDIFGTGMQHLVRVTNGVVECWPSLGYGKFGQRVLLDHAPRFGKQMDASRLFLADLDGSGTADLIYVHSDRVQIWFNQSGNSFSEPITIYLPSKWEQLNQIRFADVYGNGTTCLVFSDNHIKPRHWCYDFCQRRKPYLLNEINNNLGSKSTITYCSSTKFYLEDKKKGNPWIVNLPFPVQVVEKTESFDLISGSKMVSSYAYHHGYYDGVEREFRGFGLVERRDAETLEDLLKGDTSSPPSPPTLGGTGFQSPPNLGDLGGKNLIGEKNVSSPPSPPTLGGTRFQSPPNLGDLGGKNLIGEKNVSSPPSPPTLGGTGFQSPPGLGDLGGKNLIGEKNVSSPPSPPTLGGTRFQSPPNLGDLGGKNLIGEKNVSSPPSPPTLGGTRFQSPPNLGDLGGKNLIGEKNVSSPPSPPTLGGTRFQSPPNLGDLGGKNLIGEKNVSSPPSPPTLGGTGFQSPPGLGDLGGKNLIGEKNVSSPPSPPTLGGTGFQSPPGLGDLGGKNLIGEKNVSSPPSPPTLGGTGFQSPPGLGDLGGKNLREETTDFYVPPILTKTWYHTGAWQRYDSLSRQYEKEYFQGDSQAYQFPDSIFADLHGEVDAETSRQAYWTLKGMVLREEVYGLDGSELEDKPYAVTETNYHVKLLQPKGENKYGVYFVEPRETLSYQYERNADDPRISHQFVLKVDDYGNVLRSCTVAYGRRQPTPNPSEEGNKIHPEQLSLKVVSEDNQFINITGEDINLLGVTLENKSYEITNLALKSGEQYFSFAEVDDYLEQVLESSNLLTWQRHYYWSPESQKSLPLGEVSPEALLYQTEVAEFGKQEVQEAFSSALNQERLEDLLSREGGYQLKENYWWNPGLTQTYNSADKFFLPQATIDPFGNATTYDYDRYHLLTVKVTDALNNEMVVEKVDYQTLQTQRIRDINQNISEVLFDPMGMVTVTSFYGTENGESQGFAALEDYQVKELPELAELMANPQDYLQGAASYFYYDLFAWKDRNVPVHAVNLIAEDYPNNGNARILTNISYSDGFGRELQSKVKVEGGLAFQFSQSIPQVPDLDPPKSPLKRGTMTQASPSRGKTHPLPLPRGESEERWLTSGRTVYNNKGNPVKQYEPYYLNTYEYVDNETLNQFGVSDTLYYDPLERVIRTETAKGFFSKVEFTPWSEKNYDVNDTVKDSSFYKNFLENYPTNPTEAQRNERDALDKAAVFYDTPVIRIMDSLGRAFMEIDNGLTSYYNYDIQGRLLESIDPRLYASNLTQGTAYYNFRYRYGLRVGSEEEPVNPLVTDSTDGGVNLSLDNAMGNHLWNRSPRNFDQVIYYDELQRKVKIRTQGIKNDGTVATDNVVETFIYGESQPNAADYNLRGQLYQLRDQSGLITNSGYDIQGNMLETSRQLTKNYQDYVNWDDKVELEEEIYTHQLAFNAIQQLIAETTPDGSIKTNSYNRLGLL